MVKQYLAILLKEVVVDGEHYTMVGKTEGMLAVLEENKNVRTEASLQFARPVVNGSPITTRMRTYALRIHKPDKWRPTNALHFEILEVQQWIDKLTVDSRFLAISELARYLGVSAGWIYKVLKAE